MKQIHKLRRPGKFIPGLFFVLTVWAALPFAAHAMDAKLVERLEMSERAFRELMKSPDARVPKGLLSQCEAVIIFPRTISVAWGIGGQYGKGVALKRNAQTSQWSAPAFYTLGGLTLGPQIGGQAIDIVLVVMNEKGLSSLLQSKATLGADAGVAMGPAGRNATATTDARLKTEIYSYSRAKGLYLGLSLKGAVVKPDDDANKIYYGKEITARNILIKMTGPQSKYDEGLNKELKKYTSKFNHFWVMILFVLGLIALVVLANRMKGRP